MSEFDQSVVDAFEAGIEGGKDDDSTKMDMIAAGASFKSVSRTFNSLMVETGRAMSKDDKGTAVANALEGLDVSDEDGFDDAIEAVMEGVTGATDKSAAALVRGYAKKNELECYKKTKSAGAGRSGFASKFYDALRANPAMTKEEGAGFINGTEGNDETSRNVKKHITHYQAIRQLVNDIASA